MFKLFSKSGSTGTVVFTYKLVLQAAVKWMGIRQHDLVSKGFSHHLTDLRHCWSKQQRTYADALVMIAHIGTGAVALTRIEFFSKPQLQC